MQNGKNEKKKNNRPAGIPPRNKQSYAQYVWIRDIYCRLDIIDARLGKIEEILGLNRKVNKGESEQSSKVGTP